MNAPAEPTPEQNAAARITAWAVGEIPGDEFPNPEGATLSAPMAGTEAEATRSFCRLLETHLGAAEGAPAGLSGESRRALLAEAAARPPSRRLVLWIPPLAAAAGLAVLFAVFGPGRTKAPALSRQPQEVPKSGKAHNTLVDEATSSTPPPATPSPEALASSSTPASASSRSEVIRIFRMGLGFYDLGQFDKAEQAFNQVLAMEPTNTAARRQLELAEREVNNYLRAARDHTRLKMLNDVDRLWETAVPGTARVPDSGQAAQETALAQENTRGEAQLPSLADGSAVPPQLPNAYYGIDFGNAPDRNNSALAEPRSGTESYRGLPENPWLSPSTRPLSTFSIDVDTASYAIIRRHLNEGQRPPADAVRLEELINYFPMDDQPPGDGKPFAVHVETASAPWAAEHRLVRVALKGKTVASTERPAANLVFLVDTSGSMDEPNKLPLVQQSLRLLLSQLKPRDRVAVVTYAGESRTVLPSTPVSESAVIRSAIDSLSSGGGTNGSGGITAAYQVARAVFQKGGVNRVVLATDGDFNIGVTSGEELEALITKEAQSGVYLSVLAYGSGNLKDSTAELLADKGNGNYAYIDSLSEARRALVSQLDGTMVTIAKDVKIQVEFNPSQVRAYRLLGYENRALADKDFKDDTKDAGEIGSGHSVTALYEIVPASASAAVATALIDPLKYQTPAPAPGPDPRNLTPQAASGELLTVKLRWQQPEGTAPSQLMEVPVKDSGATLVQAGANFRWTAAVAGYGLLLKKSPPAGSLTWDSIRSLAAGAKGSDPDGFRGEFLQLIDKAAGTPPP